MFDTTLELLAQVTNLFALEIIMCGDPYRLQQIIKKQREKLNDFLEEADELVKELEELG